MDLRLIINARLDKKLREWEYDYIFSRMLPFRFGRYWWSFETHVDNKRDLWFMTDAIAKLDEDERWDRMLLLEFMPYKTFTELFGYYISWRITFHENLLRKWWYLGTYQRSDRRLNRPWKRTNFILKFFLTSTWEIFFYWDIIWEKLWKLYMRFWRDKWFYGRRQPAEKDFTYFIFIHLKHHLLIGFKNSYFMFILNFFKQIFIIFYSFWKNFVELILKHFFTKKFFFSIVLFFIGVIIFKLYFFAVFLYFFRTYIDIFSLIKRFYTRFIAKRAVFFYILPYYFKRIKKIDWFNWRWGNVVYGWKMVRVQSNTFKFLSRNLTKLLGMEWYFYIDELIFRSKIKTWRKYIKKRANVFSFLARIFIRIKIYKKKNSRKGFKRIKRIPRRFIFKILKHRIYKKIWRPNPNRRSVYLYIYRWISKDTKGGFSDRTKKIFERKYNKNFLRRIFIFFKLVLLPFKFMFFMLEKLVFKFLFFFKIFLGLCFFYILKIVASIFFFSKI